MLTTHLTEDQLSAYHDQGYVILPGVFGEREIAEMRSAADRLLELVVNSELALGARNPRLDAQRRDGKLIVRKIQPVVDASDVLARYASDQRLIGPMRQILGCEPLLMEEKLNYKQVIPDVGIEAGTKGEKFLAHTDWAYYSQQGYPKETLSSAISLDETTPRNGPIRVLPGSHTRDWPVQDPVYNPVLPPDTKNEDDFIDVLAPAGSVMIFHSGLVHNSRPNDTGRPRRLMIFSHYPATHDAEPDARNRGARAKARAHEGRYRELVATGQFKDTFIAPSN